MGHITLQGSGGGAGGNAPDFAALTDAILTPNPANWAPPATTEGWRLVYPAAQNQQVRGLVAPAVGAQSTFWIVNDTPSRKFKLKAENVGSQSANRFMLPDDSDYEILEGSILLVTYNHTASRWMIVGDGKQ